MPLLCLFQKCGAGFFLSQSGECLPCDCNGNSNECMDGSGFCVVGRGHFSLLTCFVGPLHLGWELNILPGRPSYLGTKWLIKLFFTLYLSL